MTADLVKDAAVIELRDIKETSELRAVEDLQQEVWGCSDREILPGLALRPLLEIGAVLLGAFSGTEMVGFVLGLPGLESGRAILHSDMLAVKAEYRSHGVGYKLKLRQREQALAKGIDRITWTFDPLQSRNAYLNFAKLGVTADRYKINYYGETSSFLHSTGTDRLWVTWELKTDRVRQRLEHGPNQRELLRVAEAPTMVQVGEHNAPVLSGYSGADSSVIEIPIGIDSLVETDPRLALRWREATRTAFTSAIDAGLVVEDFFRLERMEQPAGVYLLSKEGVISRNRTISGKMPMP
ncbi:MAG: GNAT family N-acetyltransferase [Pyrinomonadaceae bacterium]|nr:GNAT family N-acetyltransferase [Pyrinomonadaceae bacterium]